MVITKCTAKGVIVNKLLRKTNTRNDVGEFDASNAANIHEVLWQCQSLFNDVKGKKK